MTGYGEASYQSDLLNLTLELRSVNNRYLKVSLRAAEPYNLLEAEFEKVIRRTIKRGTIQVHLRCQRRFSPQDFQINAVALRSYLAQLQPLCAELRLPDGGQALLSQALALPGVVPEPANAAFSMEEEWPVIERHWRSPSSASRRCAWKRGRRWPRSCCSTVTTSRPSWSRSGGACRRWR